MAIVLALVLAASAFSGAGAAGACFSSPAEEGAAGASLAPAPDSVAPALATRISRRSVKVSIVSHLLGGGRWRGTGSP